jgi:hypothetical protein
MQASGARIPRISHQPTAVCGKSIPQGLELGVGNPCSCSPQPRVAYWGLRASSSSENPQMIGSTVIILKLIPRLAPANQRRNSGHRLE